MPGETEIFIQGLFASCARDSEPAYLTFTAIHPDGEHPTPSRHIPLGNTAAMQYAIQRLQAANEREWGAYLGIAPRAKLLERWSRGGKADLQELPALFIDVDQPDDLLFRLLRFPLPPSCLVSSGKGYHAYWFLTTPTRDLPRADLLLHGLADYFESDNKMSVAQSMRLPGTRNTKAGRDGAFCHLETFHEDWRYQLGDFSPYLPCLASRSIIRHPAGPPASDWRIQDRQAAIEAVTERVIQDLDGHYKPNGWIAARCPCPHCRDKPGMHFSFHPESGVGYCFGKHGKLSLAEMCRLLQVLLPSHDTEAASV